jgi:hypothetical protein
MLFEDKASGRERIPDRAVTTISQVILKFLPTAELWGTRPPASRPMWTSAGHKMPAHEDVRQPHNFFPQQS